MKKPWGPLPAVVLSSFAACAKMQQGGHLHHNPHACNIMLYLGTEIHTLFSHTLFVWFGVLFGWLVDFVLFSWQDFFESYISIASTVPSVLCLIGNFLLINK